MRVRGSRALPPDLGLGGVENGGEAGQREDPCRAEDTISAEGSALPCQNSHKCNGTPGGEGTKPLETPVELTPSARRTALALQLNVAGMIERHGVERVGFLTLTFAEHITCPKRAQRRMHSLRTGVLKQRYGEVITVMERQKSGRIHYHCLVALKEDIRTGVDFDALARGDYRSANAALRAEWAFWRKTAKAYGFGRTELLPVRSTMEAMSRYLGKYITKHVNHREPRDRGVKLVRYTGPKVASTRFAWVSPGAAQWRAKLGAFVQMLYESGVISHPTEDAMYNKFGPRWVWKWRDSIMSFPI
jgi:hypothetical protein